MKVKTRRVSLWPHEKCVGFRIFCERTTTKHVRIGIELNNLRIGDLNINLHICVLFPTEKRLEESNERKKCLKKNVCIMQEEKKCFQ